MEQKVYIVSEEYCKYDEPVQTNILGLFTNIEAARKCLADAKEQTLREWDEDIDDEWNVVDTPDFYDMTYIAEFDNYYRVEVSEQTLQDTYTGWQELTEQMDVKQLEAFNQFTKEFCAGVIYNRAARDHEKPMGVILSYLRDQGLPKTQGWLVGEAILKYLHIDNEKCPWLNNN